MPSIEKLFATLDSFKPIPTQKLTRLPNSLRITNRIKLALSFDVLIGDGFLAIESENAKFHCISNRLDVNYFAALKASVWNSR